MCKVCAYVWVYYKTMGEVGKIIAQLSQGKVDMDGWVWVSSCHHHSLTFLFLGRLRIIVVCVHSSAFDHR